MLYSLVIGRINTRVYSVQIETKINMYIPKIKKKYTKNQMKRLANINQKHKEKKSLATCMFSFENCLL